MQPITKYNEKMADVVALLNSNCSSIDLKKTPKEKLVPRIIALIIKTEATITQP